MYLPGDLVGENLVFATLQRLERHPDDLLGRALRRVDPAGEIGVDEAGVEAENLRPLAFELDAQAIGERPSGGFRGAVGREQRSVHPARHREHIDDRAAAVLPEDRGERPRHAQRSEEVHLELLTGGLDRAVGKETARHRDAGIVDQQGDVGRLAGGGRDIRIVRDVELQRDDALQRDGVGVARPRIDFGRSRL